MKNCEEIFCSTGLSLCTAAETQLKLHRLKPVLRKRVDLKSLNFTSHY